MQKKYQYSVLFWSHPKTGFHVAKYNAIMNMLDDLAKEYPHLKVNSFKELNEINGSSEGFVPYEEVVESDTKIVDPEKEVMPIIRERYPEARFAFLRLIPFSKTFDDGLDYKIKH